MAIKPTGLIGTPRMAPTAQTPTAQTPAATASDARTPARPAAAGEQTYYQRGERQQNHKQTALRQRGQKQAGMKRQGLKQQALRQQSARHEGVAGSNGGAGAHAEDMSPAAQLRNFADASASRASVMGQFLSRRDFDKKADESGDRFAQVLDDDSAPKARLLIKVAQSPAISAEELLRQARSMFPDDSDLILVLRELLRRRQLDALVRNRLEGALKQAGREAPPKALKAGINVALKARLFGATLSINATLLRASYRQFLEHEADTLEIYEEWIVAYGHTRRALVLEFLEAALVSDMLAQDPSCSHVEFGDLLGKLGQLKLLRSAEAVFVAAMLADRLVAVHNDNEADWLMFMLALLHAPEDLDALLSDVVGASILLSPQGQRAMLLQAVRNACRALPHSLLSEADAGLLWERFDALSSLAYRQEIIANRRERRHRTGSDHVCDLLAGEPPHAG